MQKYPLIGISISVACVIILASFTSVVGVQPVESSNQELINDEIDQKELLFETIIDIANDPDVQEILEQVGYDLFDSDYNFRSVFFKLLIYKPRVLSFMFSIKPKMSTEYLNKAYNNGIEIVNVLGEQEALEMIESVELKNPQILNDLTEIISNNPELQQRIKQLADLPCDCENDNTTSWNYPVICTLLYPLVGVTWGLVFVPWIIFGYEPYYLHNLYIILVNIGIELNCWWA